MTEMLSKEKQQAKKYKPSRLRHELCPTSNEETECQKTVRVREPPPDSLLSGATAAQHRHCEGLDQGHDNISDYGEEVPLSPKSAAILERNAITKITEPGAPSPIVVKLLSKEGFGLEDSPAFSPPFVFRQARKMSSKTSPKDQPNIAQSSMRSNLPDGVIDQVGGHFPDNEAPQFVQDQSHEPLECNSSVVSESFSHPTASKNAQENTSDQNDPQATRNTPLARHPPSNTHEGDSNTYSE